MPNTEEIGRPEARVLLEALEIILDAVKRRSVVQTGIPISPAPFSFAFWELEILRALAKHPHGLTIPDLCSQLKTGLSPGTTLANIRECLTRLQPARLSSESLGRLETFWNQLGSLSEHASVVDECRSALDICIEWKLLIVRDRIPQSKNIKCRLIVARSTSALRDATGVNGQHAVLTPLSSQRHFSWAIAGGDGSRKVDAILLHKLPSPTQPLFVDCQLLPTHWTWQGSKSLLHLSPAEKEELAGQLENLWTNSLARGGIRPGTVFHVLQAIPDPSDRILTIEVQPAEYSEYIKTNRSLSQAITLNGQKKTFQQILHYDPAWTFWDLCNPLACSILLISRAGNTETALISLQDRFKQVGGGLWTPTVVGTVGAEDLQQGNPRPLHTARREAIEELRFVAEEDEYEWLGFGCRLDVGHYSLVGELKTELGLDAINSLRQAAKDKEVEQLHGVELLPDTVLGFLKRLKRENQKCTPFLEMALALALSRRYPDSVSVHYQ